MSNKLINKDDNSGKEDCIKILPVISFIGNQPDSDLFYVLYDKKIPSMYSIGWYSRKGIWRTEKVQTSNINNTIFGDNILHLSEIIAGSSVSILIEGCRCNGIILSINNSCVNLLTDSSIDLFRVWSNIPINHLLPPCCSICGSTVHDDDDEHDRVPDKPMMDAKVIDIKRAKKSRKSLRLVDNPPPIKE